MRSIEKALGASGDAATRQALDEARNTLAACLALNGVAPASGGGNRGMARPTRTDQAQPEEVVRHVAGTPGCRCEDIAAALGADTKAVSAVLKALKDEGRLRTEGQAGGTRNFRRLAVGGLTELGTDVRYLLRSPGGRPCFPDGRSWSSRHIACSFLAPRHKSRARWRYLTGSVAQCPLAGADFFSSAPITPLLDKPTVMLGQETGLDLPQ